MIAYLKGTIKNIKEGCITIIVNDVIGYDVFLSQVDIAVCQIGSQLELFCYHHITDRGQSLYGFLNKSAKDLFLLLIDNVAGIGPKSALKIIGKAQPQDLINVIESGDVDMLASYGLGKKTAEKIMLGLKDKLMITDAPNLTPKQSDAIDALVNLGYSNQEAREALKNVKVDENTVEEIIKAALKNF